MTDMYRQKVLDHYKFPRNFGELQKPTHAFGHQNISCGDQLQFQAVIQSGVVKEIAFTGSGCAISVASASLLTEFLIGKKFADIEKMNTRTIEKLLGFPVSGARELCAILGLETVKRLKKK